MECIPAFLTFFRGKTLHREDILVRLKPNVPDFYRLSIANERDFIVLHKVDPKKDFVKQLIDASVLAESFARCHRS
jgi:hypothetical protein